MNLPDTLDPLASQQFNSLVADTPLAGLQEFASTDFLRSLRHGKLNEWLQLLESTPRLQASIVDLQSQVRIGKSCDATAEERAQLLKNLQALIPWRKGPFNLFDIDIDTEWCSDMKWQRLQAHISPLAGRTVLDVGCGSGYHCLRMLGEQARLVIGIEPHLPYVMQFAMVKRFVPATPVFVLPITMERMPPALGAFDTVFSMGVLYHRRSPLDHLLELKSMLRKGGELILETLVVDGPDGYALLPEERYCRMSNVWFLSSCATTESWLRRCGFSDIRLVDLSTTSVEEQRATAWMPFQSLQDGLDPDDSSLTIEGLPAPRRAVFIARLA